MQSQSFWCETIPGGIIAILLSYLLLTLLSCSPIDEWYFISIVLMGSWLLYPWWLPAMFLLQNTKLNEKCNHRAPKSVPHYFAWQIFRLSPLISQRFNIKCAKLFLVPDGDRLYFVWRSESFLQRCCFDVQAMGQSKDLDAIVSVSEDSSFEDSKHLIHFELFFNRITAVHPDFQNFCDFHEWKWWSFSRVWIQLQKDREKNARIHSWDDAWYHWLHGWCEISRCRKGGQNDVDIILLSMLHSLSENLKWEINGEMDLDDAFNSLSHSTAESAHC